MIGYTNSPILPEKAKELLSLDTEYKEIITYGKIEEWYTALGGKVYVSFSGGKDSTVLAYLVANWLSHFRTPPWLLTLVFVNTGLEYPEVQHFVDSYAEWLRKKFPNVTVDLVRLRPKLNIRQVIEQYGYPIVSKEVAAYVEEARIKPDGRSAARLRGEYMRKDGVPSMYNCSKWGYLVYAPFNISSRCCGVMKKLPMNSFARETGAHPITAVMAEESRLRKRIWLKNGCNALEGKHPMSKPMSFWTEQDVLRFIVDRQIPIASVYGDIVTSDGENDYDATLVDCPLHCTGCQRTGCMFCGFGAHLEKGENRFERMKRTHPRHYDFCIGGGAYDPADGLWKPNEKGLGYGRVLDYIGVRY